LGQRREGRKGRKKGRGEGQRKGNPLNKNPGYGPVSNLT